MTPVEGVFLLGHGQKSHIEKVYSYSYFKSSSYLGHMKKLHSYSFLKIFLPTRGFNEGNLNM